MPPQAKLYPRILAAMKPGATLGLSHGFLLGVMQNDGVDFRPDINVVLNAPKVGSPSPFRATAKSQPNPIPILSPSCYPHTCC